MSKIVIFPGLGLEFELNPIAFSVFGWDVHWYGVIIACGFLLAVAYCYWRAPRFGVDQEKLIDMLFFAVPLCIIGARAYYVIFNPAVCFNADGSFSLYNTIAIWDGGLAIYGGVIAGFLTAYLFSRRRKISFWALADCCVQGLFIGQAIGRWGNFFNREAHGGVTTCFLRMGLVENGALQYFHPTFLYESVWNLTGFVVLHFLSKKRKFDGQMFLAYLAWYGAGRMVIEGLRTDSLWLGPVRVSQLLAAVTMLLSLGILLYQAIFVRHDPAKMQVNRVAAAEAAAATAAETQPEETAEPEDAASEPEDEASGKTEESIEPDESKE